MQFLYECPFHVYYTFAIGHFTTVSRLKQLLLIPHEDTSAQACMQYLSLLQGDLALFLAADERPVTPEDLVTSPQLMSKGCWEKSDPVLNYTLKKGGT